MMRNQSSRIYKFQIHHILRAYKSNIADSSFNPRLIKKYKKLLDDYWNPSGKTYRFHEMNRILVPQIYNTFFGTTSLDIDKLIPRSEFQKCKVLDIGCGGGITSESLAELKFNVIGIDPNPDLISIAKSHQKKNRHLHDKSLSYYNTTVEEFVKLHSRQFDIIIISEVLEYMPFWKKQSFLKLCTSFCKDDGKIFITTITDNSLVYYRYYQLLITATLDAATFNCFRGISKNALSAILATSGCVVRMTRGIDVNLYTRKFEFSADSAPWVYLFAIKQHKIH